MYGVKAFMNGGARLPNGRTFPILYQREGQDARRVIFHPMYQHNNFRYDLAIIELATPVTDQRPIQLPTADSEYRSKSYK